MKLTQTLIVTAAAFGLFTSAAFAQMEQLEGAGHSSHNTPEDLANSLRPGPPKRGKEKLEEVDSAKLKSAPVKNKTFEGTLLDSSTVQLDENNSAGQKQKSAKSSVTDKTNDAGNTVETAADKEKTSKSTDGDRDGHGQKKEKQTPSTTTTRSDDKAATAKNDGGDH